MLSTSTKRYAIAHIILQSTSVLKVFLKKSNFFCKYCKKIELQFKPLRFVNIILNPYFGEESIFLKKNVNTAHSSLPFDLINSRLKHKWSIYNDYNRQPTCSLAEISSCGCHTAKTPSLHQGAPHHDHTRWSHKSSRTKAHETPGTRV